MPFLSLQGARCLLYYSDPSFRAVDHTYSSPFRILLYPKVTFPLWYFQLSISTPFFLQLKHIQISPFLRKKPDPPLSPCTASVINLYVLFSQLFEKIAYKIFTISF